MKSKSIWLGALLAAVMILSGCNTVRGVGQDVQKVGTSIENAGKK